MLLLLNKLSEHKKVIYDSIAASLSKQYAIDPCIHDGDFSFFISLLKDKSDEYDYYVIMPHFVDGECQVMDAIRVLRYSLLTPDFRYFSRILASLLDRSSSVSNNQKGR